MLAKQPIPTYDDNHVLLKLSRKGDTLTVRDAKNGIQIIGMPGMGKTNGSGRALAMSFLKKKYGGLVMSVKNGEADNWLIWAKLAGQIHRIVVMSSPKRLQEYKEQYPELEINYDHFNPLIYEYQRDRGQGGGNTDQIVRILTQAIEMARRVKNPLQTHASGDSFWQDNMEALLKNTIGLLKLAHESREGDTDFTLGIENIGKFINTLPRGEGKTLEDSEYPKAVMLAADERLTQLGDIYKESEGREEIPGYEEAKEVFQKANSFYESAERYLCTQFIPMAEKQRSGIEGQWTGFSQYFTGEGVMATRFTAKENSERLIPETTMYGEEPNIIILDFPSLVFQESGTMAQIYYKMIWQNTVEARKRSEVEKEKPCFLWMDEAHYFVGRRDQKFLTTAREAKCISVFMTQNKVNYDDNLGHTLSNAFLGMIKNFFFHANGCVTTNNWAEQIIGQTEIWKPSYSQQSSGLMLPSYQEVQRNQIEAYEFTELEPDFDKMFTPAVYYSPPGAFSNGLRYLPVQFDMKLGERAQVPSQKLQKGIHLPYPIKDYLTRTLDPIIEKAIPLVQTIKFKFTTLWHSIYSPASDQNTSRTE